MLWGLKCLEQTRFAVCWGLLALVFNSAHAQETTAETDPLDLACAKIGAPLSEDEITKLSGLAVKMTDGSFIEVLGDLSKPNARSVRHKSASKRSAVFARIDGRRFCIKSEDGADEHCSVPLRCGSKEARYLLIDRQDRPLATIAPIGETRSDFPLAGGQSDWVTHAGGSFSLNIEKAPLEGRRSGAVIDASTTRRCAIGAGHPVIDKAFAYAKVRHQSCSSGQAAGSGKVFVLHNDGSTQTLEFGAAKGIELRSGRPSWNFPRMSVQVTCNGTSPDIIPSSAREVASVDVAIRAPKSVLIQYPTVYTKIVRSTEDQVEEICGKGMNSNVRYRFVESFGSASAPALSLKWDAREPRPLGFDSAIQARISQDKQDRASQQSRFAPVIRQIADDQQTAEIFDALNKGRFINNISNSLNEARVQTLVAMTSGVETYMPWARSNAEFTNGEFRLFWDLWPQDSVVQFFANRTTSGWQAIQRRVPSGIKSRSNFRMTCLVSAAEARKLKARNWVTVQAQMISFSGNSMVMRCNSN